jgi:hypothetical protein
MIPTKTTHDILYDEMCQDNSIIIEMRGIPLEQDTKERMRVCYVQLDDLKRAFNEFNPWYYDSPDEVKYALENIILGTAEAHSPSQDVREHSSRQFSSKENQTKGDNLSKESYAGTDASPSPLVFSQEEAVTRCVCKQPPHKYGSKGCEHAPLVSTPLMFIVPLKDADFSLVYIEHVSNTPYCRVHGAMNKLTANGIWRCISSVGNRLLGKGPNKRLSENDCLAGCQEFHSPSQDDTKGEGYAADGAVGVKVERPAPGIDVKGAPSSPLVSTQEEETAVTRCVCKQPPHKYGSKGCKHAPVVSTLKCPTCRKLIPQEYADKYPNASCGECWK